VFSKFASQIVTLVTAPIITRLFSPNDFGIYQIFVSVVGILLAMVCLKYELSIPLGKNKNDAVASFTLSLFLAFIFSLLLLALVPIVKEHVARWYKLPELENFIWLVPIAVFLFGVKNIMSYWASRESKFGTIAISDFAYTSSSILITLIWGLVIGASTIGMLFGYLAGLALGIITFLIFLVRRLATDIRDSNIKFAHIWSVAKLHRKFPIFSTWSSLLNTISVQLPPIIFGLYFPINVVGYYSLGQRIVAIPMILIGTAIGQVFFPSGAKRYNETGDISEIVSSVFKRLAQIGISPIFILILLGPILFRTIFGQEWVEAGVYAQILAVWSLFSFVYSPLSLVFSIFNRQNIEFFTNIFIISGRTTILLIGSNFLSPRMTLIIFVVFSVLAVVFLIAWMLKLSKVSIFWTSKIMMKYIILSCILIVPIKLTASFLGDMGVLLASISAMIIYVIILSVFEPELRRLVFNCFSKSKRLKNPL